MLKRSSIPGCFEQKEIEVSHCQQDSRLIFTNDLFFALPGEKSNGHNFLAEAKNRGAIAAVVDSHYQGSDCGLTLFRSQDVLASLQELAKEELQKRKTKIVAITGSVGKTTTKEFLYTLLQNTCRVEKTVANQNSQITLPLTILNTKEDAEILILEMGMSKRGELEKLVSIAKPDIALITKVALAHAMNFEDGLVGIAKAKTEIFKEEKTKTKIINKEILAFVEVPNAITYSMTDCMADYYLSQTEEKIHIDERGVRSLDLLKPFEEQHLLEDLLAAVSIARQIGIKWDEISSRISSLHTPPLRWEKIQKGHILFINDCYNANLTSMQAALKALSHYKGRKVAVLGEMLELGKFSFSCHEEVGKSALENKVDEVVCFGKETMPIVEIFKKENKPASFFLDKEELIGFLQKSLHEEDVVLIKGSRGCGLEKILERL